MMFALERWILGKADYVSSISEGMIKKIKAKYNRHIVLFPNWTDTQAFHPMPGDEAFRKKFGFSATDKIVLYSGAIGEKQGLQNLLHTAREMLYRTDVKIVICGSGPYKESLVEMAKQLNLSNVYFLPLQPREHFNKFLNMADVHLVLQKSHANDLMMPSKLTSIFSVGGLALVTAEPSTSLHEVVAAHKMGLLIEPENPAALTAGILHALDQPHTELKQNAREYAENHLNIDHVISRYLAHITSPVKVIPISSKYAASIEADAVAH